MGDHRDSRIARSASLTPLWWLLALLALISVTATDLWRYFDDKVQLSWSAALLLLIVGTWRARRLRVIRLASYAVLVVQLVAWPWLFRRFQQAAPGWRIEHTADTLEQRAAVHPNVNVRSFAFFLRLHRHVGGSRVRVPRAAVEDPWLWAVVGNVRLEVVDRTSSIEALPAAAVTEHWRDTPWHFVQPRQHDSYTVTRVGSGYWVLPSSWVADQLHD